MFRFLQHGGLLKLIAALSLTLLVSLAGTPTQAAQRQQVGRGWQVFLGNSVVRKPTGVAIDLRGARGTPQWGYVADSATGKIVKFGTGGRVLGSWWWALPGHAAAMAVGGSGNLFVADRSGGFITKFSPTGKLLAGWAPMQYAPEGVPAYTDPRGIAVDPSGNIYVAEYSSHTVIQLTPAGKLAQTWDTSKGFTTQYSVPHENSGPFGNPTGVVYDQPGHIFISTVCVPDPACSSDRFASVQAPGHDALLVLSTSGPYNGYVGNFWFGLGYAASGSPVETPGKESEPFVHIDAMAGDGRGHTFLAGTMWPRGGQPSLGVLSYTDLGSYTAPWRLPSQTAIAGVAVDRSGSVYVSQGTRLLKRSP